MPKPKPQPTLFEPALIDERRSIFRTDSPEQFFAAMRHHGNQFEVIRLGVGQTNAQWIFGVLYPEPKQEEMFE